MTTRDDLRRVERAIVRISRIGTGRDAARIRSERSGIVISRPGIAILSALRASGPMRLTLLANLTDLEAPLISREVRQLTAAGYIRRSPDPTDGRATIVELTAEGRRAYEAYRAATDDIIAETFADWSAEDLAILVAYLERVASDFARGPRQPGGRRPRTVS